MYILLLFYNKNVNPSPTILKQTFVKNLINKDFGFMKVKYKLRFLIKSCKYFWEIFCTSWSDFVIGIQYLIRMPCYKTCDLIYCFEFMGFDCELNHGTIFCSFPNDFWTFFFLIIILEKCGFVNTYKVFVNTCFSF